MQKILKLIISDTGKYLINNYKKNGAVILF